jgi:hypothetical protein
MYIAVSVGSYAVLAIRAIRTGVVEPMMKGNALMIVPLVLGVLILTNQLGRKVAWLSRYPLWITMGVGTALAMRGAVHAEVIGQIKTLFKFAKVGATPLATFNNLISVVFTVVTFAYFFFYFLHRSPVGSAVQRSARLPLMLAFGIAFGTGIMLQLYFGAWSMIWLILLGPESLPKGSQNVAYVIEAVIILFIIASIQLLGKRKVTAIKEESSITN